MATPANDRGRVAAQVARQRTRAAAQRRVGDRVQSRVDQRTAHKNFSAPSPFRVNIGGRTVHTQAGDQPINVRGLQAHLRSLGYDIAVDGKLGPLTRRALADAVGTGRLHANLAEESLIHGVKGMAQSPHTFDAMLHAADPKVGASITGGKHSILTGNGSIRGHVRPLPPGAGQGMGSNGTLNLKATNRALKASTGHDIPASDANFGQLFNVDKTANALAQEQFQPQINEQQLLVNRDPVQAAQNEKDVADWYKQVQDAQGNAATADAAATKQGVDATNAQTQALVQSLGGSANQGSGMAAAAGQNGANTLQAIGAAQSGLDQELAPILAAQAAQQKTNQANIDQTKLENDQQLLQNLQGQEGNAETAAQMQLQSANNSLDQARSQALQQILQYNNSLAQQKFQNQLGLTDAQIAAMMNGVNIAKTNAESNYYNARANYYGGGGGSRSASQLNDIQKQLIAALGSKGLITGANGVYKLAPGVKPQQALAFSRNFTQQYGNLPGSFLSGTLGVIQGY